MEIGTRLIGAFLKIVIFLTAPWYYFLALKTHQKLPPIADPLLTQSATTLARRIRNGEIKSEAVVKAFIARIEEVNPLLNAVVEQRYDAALDDARKVDELVASGRKTRLQLETETPFLGVPLSIKESCGVQGMSHTVGTLTRTGFKAEKDGEAVHNLRMAGAIPLVASTTPELCLSWETNNLVTGRTVNAYDPNRTCGGSSGGEGALLGSGASVMGVGSDVAGSIRLPALYNGIFGHKPSPDSVSVEGHYPHLVDPRWDQFMGVGPMTRYAEDLRPMLAAMAGEKANKLRLNEKVDLKNLKVFYMENAGPSLLMLAVESEIKAALNSSVQHLQAQHGASVQKVQIEEMGDSVEISCAVFFSLEGLPNLLANEENPKEDNNIYVELLKSVFGLSRVSSYALGFSWLFRTNAFIPRRKVERYIKECEALRKKFIDLLKDDGVFIYPTHPTPALYHEQSLTKTAGVCYTMIFNVLGLPSTHVPLGLNKEGLPIGIQVVGAPYQDRLCLSVAEELEKQFGGWVPPPSS